MLRNLPALLSMFVLLIPSGICLCDHSTHCEEQHHEEEHCPPNQPTPTDDHEPHCPASLDHGLILISKPTQQNDHLSIQTLAIESVQAKPSFSPSLRDWAFSGIIAQDRSSPLFLTQCAWLL